MNGPKVDVRKRRNIQKYRIDIYTENFLECLDVYIYQSDPQY